jgi:hypothetical protein
MISLEALAAKISLDKVKINNVGNLERFKLIDHHFPGPIQWGQQIAVFKYFAFSDSLS